MSQSQINNFNINNLGGASEFQSLVVAMMANVNTGELVEVVAVDAVGLAPVGFVSVKPLVFKVDGDNNNVERGIVHNVPYFRLQGGSNAVIIDPQVGDIGFCGVCSRDISLAKRVKSYAIPNSRRASDISDAIYLGGVLNSVPEQYVWFKENEVVVKSTTKVTIDAPNTETTGNLKVNGTITSTSNASIGGSMTVASSATINGAVNTLSTITAIGNIVGAGVSLRTHVHIGVQSGSSTSGVPLL